MPAETAAIALLEHPAALQQWLEEHRGEPAWLREWRWFCARQAQDRLTWPESRYTRLTGFHPERYGWPTSLHTVEHPQGQLDPTYTWIIIRDDTIFVEPPRPEWQAGVRITRFRTLVEQNDPRLLAFLKEETLIPLDLSRASAYLLGLWQDGLWIEFLGTTSDTVPHIGIRIERTRSGEVLNIPIVIRTHPHGSGTVLLEMTAASAHLEGMAIVGLDVTVGQDGALNLQCVWNDAERAYDFVFYQAAVHRDGRLQWASGWFGGRLTQGRHHIRLHAPGADLRDVHVLFGHERQHFDTQLYVQHLGPYTTSDVLMRGVLKDRARNVFYGMVRLEPEAQNADAFLADHILMLNPGAHADAIPALEIEANQVRCGHSASVGEIDEEQLFYLMSRGLDEQTARKLIVEGFLAPAIEAIKLKDVRERILTGITRKWAEE